MIDVFNVSSQHALVEMVSDRTIGDNSMVCLLTRAGAEKVMGDIEAALKNAGNEGLVAIVLREDEEENQ